MTTRPTIPDVLIGVATYREINTKTVGCILQMMMFCQDARWGYSATDTVNVPFARNKIMSGFLEMEAAEYLFFIDQDMVFEPADAQMLLRAIQDDPEIGCIAGFYVKRDGSQVPLCAWFDEDRPWHVMANDEILDRLEASRGMVVDADVLPTGFMMIRKEAVRDLTEPWFHTLYPTMDNGELSPDMWSSDTVFCHKLREAGWKTKIHLGIEVGHIGDFTYHPNHFWNALPAMRSIAQRDVIKDAAAVEFGVNSVGYWDSVWKAEDELEVERDYDVLHAQILPFVSDGARVLDIGCGCGQLLSRLVEHRNAEPYGMDFSPEAIGRCKSMGIEGEVFDIKTDRLERQHHHAYDVVVCTEVVEHFEDEGPLLKACHAALKPGGTFILSCPANCHGPDVEAEHVRVISDEEVAGWFERYDDFQLGRIKHYWLAIGKKKPKP